MKVKIKENINLEDLKEDTWNGCKYDTMLFLQMYYDGTNETFEVKEMSGMGNYIITIEGKDWIINPKVFEIIEEDKKIKKLEHLNSRYYLENTANDLSTKAIALDIETLRHWINEIIDFLKENKND